MGVSSAMAAKPPDITDATGSGFLLRTNIRNLREQRQRKLAYQGENRVKSGGRLSWSFFRQAADLQHGPDFDGAHVCNRYSCCNANRLVEVFGIDEVIAA